MHSVVPDYSNNIKTFLYSRIEPFLNKRSYILVNILSRFSQMRTKLLNAETKESGSTTR